MSWTIVIAGLEQEALEAAHNIVLDFEDVQIVSIAGSRLAVEDSRGQRGRVDCISASQGHRALEGARPDNIVIAGDYLRWNLRPLELTHLWQQIQHILLITPGARVRWA